MHVLACADLHGNHRAYEWLVAVAADLCPDVMVLAGDLLGCPDGFYTVEEAQRADAAKILAILRQITRPVFYLMGNDDMIELGSALPTIRSIHGDRVDVGDVNFVGYQYSLPFMGGIYERPEEGILEDLTTIEALVDERSVFVTHCPAYGVLDLGVMHEHAGSIAIKELIERKRPLVHIHGHIHQGFGNQGRHFNVAAAGSPRAVLIDPDTKHHRVVLESAV